MAGVGIVGIWFALYMGIQKITNWRYKMYDETTEIEFKALKKSANRNNKYLEDRGMYCIGDICRGDWVIGLSKPFQMEEILDLRAEGGKINTHCMVWKQYVYVA